MRSLVAPSLLLSIVRRSLGLNVVSSSCTSRMTAAASNSNSGTSPALPLGLDPNNCKVAEIRQQIRLRGYTPSAKQPRTKAGLLGELEGLVRAESFAYPDFTTRSNDDDAIAAAGGIAPGRWNPDAGWVDRAAMERGPRGYRLCRFCNEETPSARRTFCSNGCVHEHRVRTQGSYVRKCLSTRDGGQCAECGIDAARLYRLAREAWASGASLVRKRNAVAEAMAGTPFEGKVPREGATRRPTQGMFWHADHIVPVVRGGGQCSLKNYRTLCVPCHAATTKRLAGERAAERGAANGGVGASAVRKRRGGSKRGGERDDDDDNDDGDDSGLIISSKGVCSAGESEGLHGEFGLHQQAEAIISEQPEESEEEDEGWKDRLPWTGVDEKDRKVVMATGWAADDQPKPTRRASMLTEPPLPFSATMTVIWKRDQ